MKMKTCWHDWDVKDKQKRIFIRRLYGLGWNWLFIISGLLSLLTVGCVSFFGFKTPPDFTRIPVIIMTGSCLFLLGFFYAWHLFLSLTYLDAATDWRDQVCRKCHRVVLDASENKEEVEAYEAIQSEIKKTLDAQKVNIQMAADESFSHQKAKWEKGEDD